MQAKDEKRRPKRDRAALEECRRALRNPELIRLYEEELAEEDVALAEEGMADFYQNLREADNAASAMNGTG